MRFRDALSTPGLAAIAEFKRRSPSLGDIRPDADPAALAAAYERSGAAAVSVLVDERFGGSWDDLRAARAAARLPLLAKGFFSTVEHLRTAKEAGADAVLLLLRDLDDAQTEELMRRAGELGLDTLVEAHDAEELDRANALGAPVIGINARDLATFAIDRRRQLELVARAPRERIVVAESGIHSRAQGAAAELAGADAILVGSALMQAPDPGAKLAELISRPARQGLRAHTRGGRRSCGGRGRRPRGLHPRRRESAPGRRRAPGPRRAARGRRLGRRDRRDAPPTSTSSTSARATTAAATLSCSARARRSRASSTCPGGRRIRSTTSEHLERAAATEGRVVLAGGLAADNVAHAIRTVRPWAVDASSRLEVEPGIKDHEKLRAYVEAARV